VGQPRLDTVTTTLERRIPRAARSRSPLPSWTVTAAATIAVIGRLPFIGRAPSPDEAGYLLVGGHWNGSGSSLYASYWVDRPPLLVTVFKFASSLGGVHALRLFGCLAALAVVVGAARVTRLLAGEEASLWTAVIAAALCLSPLLGVYAVNGELLAAPFVVGGVGAVVRAIQAPERRRAMVFAAVAGVMAVCAALVKQNFVDVAVFAAVVLAISSIRREVPTRRRIDLSVAFLAGTAATLALFAAWTAAHGTSLGGVFYAMYPFRVRAGNVIAAAGADHASARLYGLIGVATTSGLLLLALAVIGDAALRRHRGTASWSVVGLLVFAAASVLLGGSYWHHYLIGLIVPLSIAAGLLAVSRPRVVGSIVAFTVASTAIAWVGALTLDQGSPGQSIGTSIAAASQAGDTIVSLYGHADVVQTSGLSSPYEHLWSLPVKTLDPRLTELDSVLSGPDAPIWLVTGPSVRSWGLSTQHVSATIARDYREVQTICDRSVYLRSNIQRAVPKTAPSCDGTTTAFTSIKDLLP